MRAIELLRDNIPSVKFTTDVIVGFPSETEEDFEASADFVRRAGFLTVHVFPYSGRKGTPAATMGEQVSSADKTSRVHRLSEIADDVREQILKNETDAGSIRDVLFETYSNGCAVGHTRDFLEVAVKTDTPLHAEIKKVRLTHTDGIICFGELA